MQIEISWNRYICLTWEFVGTEPLKSIFVRDLEHPHSYPHGSHILCKIFYYFVKMKGIFISTSNMSNWNYGDLIVNGNYLVVPVWVLLDTLVFKMFTKIEHRSIRFNSNLRDYFFINTNYIFHSIYISKYSIISFRHRMKKRI